MGILAYKKQVNTYCGALGVRKCVFCINNGEEESRNITIMKYIVGFKGYVSHDGNACG